MKYDRNRDKRYRRRLTLSHDGRPFLDRWGLVNDRWGGFYLHHVADADPGMDLHDHPWVFVTFILRGGYTEQTAQAREATLLASFAERWPDTCTSGVERSWGRFSVHRMPLNIAHRITAAKPGTWTLVLRGPTRRMWGFFIPDGWIGWKIYPYETRRPSTVPNDSSGVHL